ncbi:MAG: C-GCAxxG-C-C family protein [Paludibacteraceae bacterium]|nr:C-GCAxxG-C-C family protein [Paludibacteraceae bacterium]
MTEQEITRRQERARELFHQGFNCAQSVFASCADLFGINDLDTALRVSASFGGGIGRMRLTCGAASGMFLLEGLQSGSAVPHDAEGKKHNYAAVQALAQAFIDENGALSCAELSGLTANGPQPEVRTDTYYKKRPCEELITSAVRIFLERKAKDER